MVTYLEPLWLNATVIVTVGSYLLVLWRIGQRLKAKYTLIWEELLRPFSFDMNSMVSMLKLGAFVLGSGRHRALSDPQLSLMIYATRILFVACMVIAFLVHQIGHQVTTPL